ncbi:MAG: ATP-binding protein [Clostridia bacterium]|nr:ATP-binding protein [Clostridia bacterium]MBQ4131385.1 ATP-binding protein [Clostridia bacterium]MBQ7107757.1 ATP-binding protein [Clostridia bacterium]MBQ9920300.1 ATP-binding protein [Clostridia bacterium]
MCMTMKLHFDVSGEDFTRAGEASGKVKSKLKQLGIAPDAVRRVAIALYEGEINLVIHAGGGEIDVEISPENIKMVLSDKGPGIADVEKAMTEGFSTATESIRSLGFGAGMGLPNMKKYSDEMKIDTKLGEGTRIFMQINL